MFVVFRGVKGLWEVQPLPGNEATRTRILAGFLLHGSAMDTCQLVYAELHACPE